MIKRIDHIAIVVDDIDLALDFWRDTLGLDLAHVEAVAEQQSAVAKQHPPWIWPVANCRWAVQIILVVRSGPAG